MDEIVKYTAEGLENFQVLVDEDTVWLTQQKIAKLFLIDRSVITKHLRNIFNEEELDKSSVCANFAHTAADGKTYNTQYYNLDAILSVGYRVNSKCATKFRQWATKVLRDYLLKGASVQHPASKKELEDLETRLTRQLDEIRQELENSEIIADAQFGEIYQALIQLTSKKGIEEKPRRRIGFKPDYV
jgi:hypothetical protein